MHHVTCCTAMTTAIEIHAMGIPNHAFSVDAHHRTAEVRRWESAYSRFRPESALSLVNARAGAWTAVDDDLLAMVIAARDGWLAASGRFNIAVLPAMIANGYDRSLADPVGRTRHDPEPAPGWNDVEIDRTRHRIRIPRGMAIDLGGIAKGALADRLAAISDSWPGGLINIGGEIVGWGRAPTADGWTIAIDHSQDQPLSLTMDPDSRFAIATSSRALRTWSTKDGAAHHVVDPRTGRPTSSAIRAVTVVAETGVAAEIATKDILVGLAAGDDPETFAAGWRFAIVTSASGDVDLLEHHHEHATAAA